MEPDDILWLIDGSGYIFRAFHALPPLQRKSDGAHVGAVSGFCNMLWRLMKPVRHSQMTDRPTHIAVIFDHPSPTFRKAIYPAYKAHRPKPPTELMSQMPLIREATTALSLASVELPGYEADDIIATYARQASEAGAVTRIISSDKDLMQLVSSRVQQLDPMNGKVYGVKGVTEKWGVPPGKMIDLQALTGDASDNIPGCPGIGPKTAAGLLDEFGTLDNLLLNTSRIKRVAIKDSIERSRGSIMISRELVALDDGVPVPVKISGLSLRRMDTPALVRFLRVMELESLLSEVEQFAYAD